MPAAATCPNSKEANRQAGALVAKLPQPRCESLLHECRLNPPGALHPELLRKEDEVAKRTGQAHAAMIDMAIFRESRRRAGRSPHADL